jgi:hypothetical protein
MYEKPSLNPAGDKPMLKKSAVLLSLICASFVGSGALMFERQDSGWSEMIRRLNQAVHAYRFPCRPLRGPEQIARGQELARELDEKINAAK